jgi:hypothetical protein
MRGCFAAGVLLLTPHGYRLIETLQAGDWVLARDEHDPAGPVTAQVVEAVFERSAALLRVRAGGQTIDTTAEHPFYVLEHGWVGAGNLWPGAVLVGHDGMTTLVEEVVQTNDYAVVYNLRVAEWSTYFVGAEDWGFSLWAHNAYLALDLKNPNHLEAQQIFSEAAKLVGGAAEANPPKLVYDNGNAWKNSDVGTSTQASYEIVETKTGPGQRSVYLETYIRIDDGFTSKTYAEKLYIAIHETVHTSDTHAVIENHLVNSTVDKTINYYKFLDEMDKKHGSLEGNIKEQIKYHENEIDVERKVKKTLIERFGSEDAIPKEVKKLMQIKDSGEKAVIDKLTSKSITC